jgi:Mg-chelatase subunit ChlI
VTPQLLRKAIEGKPVTGPGKTRLLRAVNRVLEQKKQEPVDIRALF